MPGSVILGHLRGKRRFVIGRAAKFLKGKRDRTDVLLARVTHQAKKRSRVDARREENSYLNVGQEMRANTFEHGRVHLLVELGDRNRGNPTLGEDCGEWGERLWLARASSI